MPHLGSNFSKWRRQRKHHRTETVGTKDAAIGYIGSKKDEIHIL
jgi:hypothetical protein